MRSFVVAVVLTPTQMEKVREYIDNKGDIDDAVQQLIDNAIEHLI